MNFNPWRSKTRIGIREWGIHSTQGIICVVTPESFHTASLSSLFPPPPLQHWIPLVHLPANCKSGRNHTRFYRTNFQSCHLSLTKNKYASLALLSEKRTPSAEEIRLILGDEEDNVFSSPVVCWALYQAGRKDLRKRNFPTSTPAESLCFLP